MLLLLTTLGAFLPSAPWARLVPVPTDTPSAMTGAPSRQIVRFNRADYILNDTGDGPATAVPTSVPAQDDRTWAQASTGRGPDGMGAIRPNRAILDETAPSGTTDTHADEHPRRPNTPGEGLQPQ